MPKAARRQSGPKAVPRAEPYPTIKTGDKLPALAQKSPASVNKSASVPKKSAAKKVTKTRSANGKPIAVEEEVKEEEEVEEVPEPAKPIPKQPTKKPTITRTTKTKAVVEEGAPEEAPESSKPTSKPTTKVKPAEDKAAGTYFDIELPGDNTNTEIPIHDTCSEVRRKINSLLSKDNQKPENCMPGEFKKDGTPKPYTKGAFCEKLGVSTRMMDTFMKAKKLMGGAESPVYPAAYKFFERKRIFEGKKKTAGRLKVEADRPDGLPLRDPNKMRMWLGPGESFSDFTDEYGQ